MEVIETLREVISALTPEEMASAKTFLKTFGLEWKGGSNKGLQLFEYLAGLANRKVADEEIELALYKKPNAPALKKLAQRTNAKVLDALIIDINIDREGMYPEKVKINIDLRKKLTQAQILHRRGKVNLAKKMLESVVKIGGEYELYEEQSIALRILIISRSLVDGDKHLPHLMKKYLVCQSMKNALMRADIFFTQITAPKDFRAALKIDESRLRKMLDEMREDFNSTGSATIGHFYLQLEAQNWQNARDYKRARTELLNNLRLIQNYPSIKTHDNLIGVMINLADNDIYLGQFERAYRKAGEARDLCKKGSHNYEICLELMFHAKFFKGEYEIAQNLLQEFTPSEDRSFVFRAGKRSYFLAATFFMLRDFQAAATNLNLINPINSDREGWNLGIRVLQIMTLIELSKYDDATIKIEALRKYFTDGNEIENDRIKTIHAILTHLSYNGYNFKPTYQEHKSLFELLNADGDLGWQTKSYELVIFHQWFFAKVSRQTFSQEIPSFQVGHEQTHGEQIKEGRKSENEIR